VDFFCSLGITPVIRDTDRIEKKKRLKQNPSLYSPCEQPVKLTKMHKNYPGDLVKYGKVDYNIAVSIVFICDNSV